MQQHDLADVLNNVAHRYPIDMMEAELRDIPRIAFNIRLTVQAAEPKPLAELEVCDLGGGIGLFSAGCAAFGMKRAVLVDDFDDSVNRRVGDSILDVHKSLGVEVVSRDVVEQGIRDLEGTFDVITSFDSMEHWHRSPKRLFGEVLGKLKARGAFVLAVPNCVNLRKRLTVPLGVGKWSRMQDWYEPETFRGHVREPDVSDLRYIARDMGLEDVAIHGRNWPGYGSSNPAIRLVSRIVDYPLSLRPSLCSTIYLVGRKGR